METRQRWRWFSHVVTALPALCSRMPTTGEKELQLRIRSRFSRTAMVGAVAAGALMFAGAATASAATFSATGPLSLQSSSKAVLTFTKAKTTITVTCPYALAAATSMSAVNSGSPLRGSITPTLKLLATNLCTDNLGGTNFYAPLVTGGPAPSGGPALLSGGAGTFSVDIAAGGEVNIGGSGPVVGKIPWGSALAYSATWTNGSVLTPSTITFNNVLLGTTTAGYAVRLSQTSKVFVNNALVTALP